MNNRPRADLRSVLCIEVGRTSAGKVQMVISLPHREGTVVTEWGDHETWEDIQGAVLGALSDWLWLSGGRQERLGLSVPEAPASPAESP